jgi:5-methylcytosine-specific restriction endonuclease McrA
MAYDGVAARAYYRQNADRIKAYNRRWRQKRRLTHPEESVRHNKKVEQYHKTAIGQAALRAGSLNTMAKKRSQLGKVTARDVLSLPSHCEQCKATDNLEIDHIIPSMHGGLNDRANLQKLCRSCHRAKTKREKAVRVDVVAMPPTQMRFL